MQKYAQFSVREIKIKLDMLSKPKEKIHSQISTYVSFPLIFAEQISIHNSRDASYTFCALLNEKFFIELLRFIC